VHLPDGVIRLHRSNGIVVDSGHAAEVIEQTELISAQQTLPMLVHPNTMEAVARRAMQILAHELDMTAVAVVGPSAVDRIISTFSPGYTTRPARYSTSTRPDTPSPG
jgi:hypothetical protein